MNKPNEPGIELVSMDERGRITIPITLRQDYGLHIGDTIRLTSCDHGILITRALSNIPLATQLANISSDIENSNALDQPTKTVLLGHMEQIMHILDTKPQDNLNETR